MFIKYLLFWSVIGPTCSPLEYIDCYWHIIVSVPLGAPFKLGPPLLMVTYFKINFKAKEQHIFIKRFVLCDRLDQGRDVHSRGHGGNVANQLSARRAIPRMLCTYTLSSIYNVSTPTPAFRALEAAQYGVAPAPL